MYIYVKYVISCCVTSRHAMSCHVTVSPDKWTTHCSCHVTVSPDKWATPCSCEPVFTVNTFSDLYQIKQESYINHHDTATDWVIHEYNLLKCVFSTKPAHRPVRSLSGWSPCTASPVLWPPCPSRTASGLPALALLKHTNRHKSPSLIAISKCYKPFCNAQHLWNQLASTGKKPDRLYKINVM